MKINLNAGFSLEPYNCTSNLNTNKHVEWTYDNSSNISFYIDHAIPNGMRALDDKKKYAWILESREIVPNIVEYVKQNYDLLSFHYEYIFTCNKELLALGPSMKYCITNAVPWVQDKKIHKKNKLVSMISSNKLMCNGHQNRLKWVSKLKNNVDLYGSGFKWIDRKEDALKDYMFSVAIENSSYNTYFTEKITDCFAAGTIPIFYGNEDIGTIFNPDGIIMLTDNFDISTLTEELYYSKMEAIEENFYIASNMQTAEDFIYLNYLS
jgi:hypothetical protein